MARNPFKRVRRLRQTDEAWECTARRARAWITPPDQDPYRPYIILTASSARKVVGSRIVEDSPTLNQVTNALAKAMRRPAPGSGGKRRPAVVYLEDEDLVQALSPMLQEIEVLCEYRHTLREVERALQSMGSFTGREAPLPGLLRSPGVTVPMVEGLFEAAASFYREAPWRWVDDSRPIEVRYPPDGRPRYAIVMGHGGQTYGLARYDSPEAMHAIYSGKQPEELMGRMQWTSLLFCEIIEVPFDDLDDMEKYGWPVAGDLAYPVPLRVSSSGHPARPGKSDLLWFEAALLAIPPFMRDHMRAQEGVCRPAKATLTVAMTDGEDSVHLSYPVPGFEIPFELDWMASEEQRAARADAACERNAELAGIFEQWLISQELTEKTVRGHLGNVKFFADAYMASGGSVDFPRPADEADRLDVDEFLSEWFLREATGVSAGTVKANIASLKKFYTCLKETDQMPAEESDEILELLREDRDYYLETARDHEKRGCGEEEE